MHRFARSAVLLGAVLLTPACLLAAEIDEFKIKRQEVFEFAEKPTATADGDRVTIAFAVKGLCDVTVAIENAEGGIIRHLASGVLGPKAPAPFQKDSARQTIVWDGKNDKGEYVDRKQAFTVRVSLGLKPQFERTLFWSPYKRLGHGVPLICPAPEGVYIWEGSGYDYLRLYDHTGEFLRTLYPFPADKLAGVVGLKTAAFPQDGKTLPLKHGPKHKSSMLTTGMNMDGMGKGSPAGSAMAVQGTRIAVAGYRLARLATDGTTGGLDVNGPPAGIDVVIKDQRAQVTPRSIAFSPDGKYVYMTGYFVSDTHVAGWLPCVTRVEHGGDGKLETFVGSTNQKDIRSDSQPLKAPMSVACDKDGRVYVADYMNSRIQVYTPDGKLFKSVPSPFPVDVMVSPKTGEICVGSWMVVTPFFTSEKTSVPATFQRYGPIDAPELRATMPLPLVSYNATLSWNTAGGRQYCLSADFHTDPVAYWLVPGLTWLRGDLGVMIQLKDLRPVGLTLLTEQKGKLVEGRNFVDDVTKNPFVVRAAAHGGGGAGNRQRLCAHPITGQLFVMEGDCADSKGVEQLMQIDPRTGKAARLAPPMAIEDMVIGADGLFYLRTDIELARFDPSSWREVPWDYGEERKEAGFWYGSQKSALTSGLVLPATGRPGCFHLGGMAINALGQVALTCYNESRKVDRRGGDENPAAKRDFQAIAGAKYTPRLYPGREVGWETHVWNTTGKLAAQDVLAGLTTTDGIGLDKDGNVYAMVAGNRYHDGKPYFLPWAETYIKVKPGTFKAVSSVKTAPIPLETGRPSRPPDMGSVEGSPMWLEGAEWLYGGVGFNGNQTEKMCSCWNTRPALDLFARSFLPEIDHYSVAVLDTNGNLILRIGTYGNVQDGKPLISDGGPPSPRSIGGDEVALYHAPYVATQTDRRLYIADMGNSRILSVKIGYHAEEKIALEPGRDVGRK